LRCALPVDDRSTGIRDPISTEEICGHSHLMKIPAILVLSMVACSIATHAYASSINVAPQGTVTASGSYSDQTPDKAIDGDWYTYWNSGDFPPQWIQVDLGKNYLIQEIRAPITQLPDGYTHHDVFIDDVLSISWDGYTVDQQTLSHVFDPPISVQTVRVETTASPSWVGWREIQLFTPAESLPVPLSMSAYLFIMLAILFAGLLHLGRTAKSR